MDSKQYKLFLRDNSRVKEKLFLLEKITKNAGFFAFDGNLSFVVASATKQKCSVVTEYVEFIPNVEIISVCNYPSFEKGFYDFLTLKERENEQIIESFISVCDLYAHNPSIPFDEFIASVVDLFQLTRTQSYLDCVGLFGELAFLRQLYEKGVCLAQFWHLSGAFSKYDIAMPNLNVEIKTSSSDSTSFRIKHSQIFNGDKNIVALVSIRPSDANGLNLEEMVNFFKTTKSFSENLKFVISLEKELQKQIDPETFRKRFVLNGVYCFDCSKISTIEKIPFNISNISYDYLFDFNDSFDSDSLVEHYLK